MLEIAILMISLFLVLWISPAFSNSPNSLPSFIVKSSVGVAAYDGRTLRDPRPEESPPFLGYPDDLLSGGLNAAGLQNPMPPLFADPRHPTPTELRRHALYTNFRAIVDTTSAGGFGCFWGPDLAPDFGPEVAHGLIPGIEYIASMNLAEKGSIINTVPIAVQIPDHFDLENPCIFLAPPSGSRGYYGGISIGEWGLFKGCAVVLSGKGTGTGVHHLDRDEVYDRNGMLTTAVAAADQAQFAVRKSMELNRFIEDHPNRMAMKHAHSEINCERLWGDLALLSVEFALWALNDWFGRLTTTFTGEDERLYLSKRNFSTKNTRVIASGLSNGAGAVLRAVEKDLNGVIDGVVTASPNITPDSTGKFEIDVNGRRFVGHGASLYHTSTLMGIYAPCAALSPSLQNTPCNSDPIGAPEGARVNRCNALHAMGLLTSKTTAAQADEALEILRSYGYESEQQDLLAGHEWLNMWRSISATYAAAHGRFAVWEKIGGITFGATDRQTGKPVPISREGAASLFSVSSGIAPTEEINIINEASANGPVLENLSISRSSNLQDLNLEGALYFRYLATGDACLLAKGLNGSDRRNHERVQNGIRETIATADLHGTPALIVTGRSDALIFPNFHSRPYYGLNQLVEGEKSRLRYIEVTHAQHFDAMISNLWLDPRTQAAQFVPLHYYLLKALDWMFDYLSGKKTELPPSQVVRAKPRGVKAYCKEDAGSDLLPEIKAVPDADDRITFDGNSLEIPA